MKKIFITGGHLAPAKAVINKLNSWEIYYVGRKYAMEGQKALALEYLELSSWGGLRYLSILTGRLQRKFFVNVGQSIFSLLKIPVGFLQSFWWIIRYRPNVVLSFGGYVGVPVVVCAWLFDIPILTHEQTPVLGLANKIISIFASKVLTFPIIREEIIKAKVKDEKLILVTGGNQGSHVINVAVGEIIEKLVTKYRVVHQTGDSNFQDFEKAKKLKNYEVKKFLSMDEFAELLAKSYIVISRAGANTVNEIVYLGKPAIFVPIPWSSGGEQEKNAQKLVDLGMAEIISQKDLNGKVLLDTVEKISKRYLEYLNNAKKGKTLVDISGVDKIIAEINKLV